MLVMIISFYHFESHVVCVGGCKSAHLYVNKWKKSLNACQTKKEINSRELNDFFFSFQTSKKQLQRRKSKT